MQRLEAVATVVGSVSGGFLPSQPKSVQLGMVIGFMSVSRRNQEPAIESGAVKLEGFS
jgi:hypothetical protein